jgi:hypothetical protein
MYHWDGPGALQHHDLLLSIPQLDMLQWTPGAGSEPVWHKRWWPLYHKTFEAGKKALIWCDSLETIEALKREFGPKFKEFLICMQVKSLREADDIISAAYVVEKPRPLLKSRAARKRQRPY